MRAVYSGRGGFPGGVRQCSGKRCTPTLRSFRGTSKGRDETAMVKFETLAGVPGCETGRMLKGRRRSMEESSARVQRIPMADKKPTTKTDRARSPSLERPYRRVRPSNAAHRAHRRDRKRARRSGVECERIDGAVLGVMGVRARQSRLFAVETRGPVTNLRHGCATDGTAQSHLSDSWRAASRVVRL